MGAAKRMFDNTYNQRQETAALAKAYLETPKKQEVIVKEERKIKQIKNGRVCSVIGIVSAMGYCLAIFALLLMPLVKETELHKMQVEIFQHQKEINRLEYEIDYYSKMIDEQVDFRNYEALAREQLGMVDRESSLSVQKADVPYVTLEEARNAYYNPTIDYMSQDEDTNLD